MLKLKTTFITCWFLGSLSASLLGGMAPQMAMPTDLQQIPGMEGISEEELARAMEELQQFFDNLSPEELAELERIGREELLKNGIDPDTLQPVESTKQTEAIAQPEKPSEPIQKPPAVRTKQEIEKILALIIEHLSSLSAKISDVKFPYMSLAELKPVIVKILGYVKLFTKEKHFELLAGAEATALFDALYDLGKSMEQHETYVQTSFATDDEENPYEIMGLPQNAPESIIKERYQKLKKQYHPSHIESSLRKNGASEKDISRAKKQATFTFEIIKDAYKTLKDKKRRTKIDREITAHLDAVRKAEDRSDHAAKLLKEAFSRALENNNLITLLEEFLKKYEPEELSQKKAQEAEEAKRLKEQKEAAQLKARPSGGGASLEQVPRYSGAGQSTGYAGGHPGGYPGMPWGHPDFGDYSFDGQRGGRGGFGEDRSSRKPSSSDSSKKSSEKKKLEKIAEKEKSATRSAPEARQVPQQKTADPYMILREVQQKGARANRTLSPNILESLIAGSAPPAIAQEQSHVFDAFKKEISGFNEELSITKSPRDIERYHSNWEHKIIHDQAIQELLLKVETIANALPTDNKDFRALQQAANELAATIVATTNALRENAAKTKIWRTSKKAPPVSNVSELLIQK